MQVNKARKWVDIGRTMGYIGLPTLPSQLRHAYARVILPYEDFCERGRNSPTSPSRGTQSKPQVNGTPGKSVHPAQNGDISAPSSPLTTSSSPLSEPPDESESKEQVANARPRRSTRRMSQGRCIFFFWPR